MVSTASTPDIIREMSMAVAPAELVSSKRLGGDWRLALAAAALSPHAPALNALANRWPSQSDVRVVALSRCSDPLGVVGEFGGAGLERLGVAANRNVSAEILNRWTRSLDWRLRWRAWQNPQTDDRVVVNAISDSLEELGTDRRAVMMTTRIHVAHPAFGGDEGGFKLPLHRTDRSTSLDTDGGRCFG